MSRADSFDLRRRTRIVRFVLSPAGLTFTTDEHAKRAPEVGITELVKAMRKEQKNPFSTQPQMTWEATQELARKILDDSISHLWDAPALGGIAPHVVARDREVFKATVAYPKGALWRSTATPSLIEQWATPAPKDWFSLVKAGLDAIETLPLSVRNSLRDMAAPLREASESLGAQLRPAPAMRGASTLERLELPSRSRRVHAADLPAFSPLFCTSILPLIENPPISGLKPGAAYRCRFRSPQAPDWEYECEMRGDDNGEVAFPISEVFCDAPQSDDEPELVWLFEESGAFRSGMSAWISGLIWRRKTPNQTVAAGLRSLFDAPEDDLSSDKTRTLLAINRLIAEERYIEAYETTRRALLFAPKPEAAKEPVPFHEALWKLTETILRSMQSRLRATEPIFRSMRPEWNGVASLDEVIMQIQPKA